MNGVAHYLFGLLITIFVIKVIDERYDDKELSTNLMTFLFITVIAFFSHILVDAIARFTYHPSESDWGNPVYASWHLSTYFAEAVFSIYILRTDIRYIFGMIGAVGFDLWDWSIRRPLEKYRDITNLPSLHWMADKTENFLFGWTPSLRNEQWALIIEVIIVILLFIAWRMLHDNSSFVDNDRPASWMEVVIILLVFGTLRLLTLV